MSKGRYEYVQSTPYVMEEILKYAFILRLRKNYLKLLT